MNRPKRPNFKPEFRLEVAQLVLDKGYSIREAADAMDVGNGSAGSRSIMKNLGLRSSQPSAPKYKKANNEHLAVPNTLNRELDVKNPNQIWCGDVTYIWIGKRWAYLAIVLDLFSRKPIGWAFSLSPDSQLTMTNFMALPD
jgi:transposase InsO family protein